MDSLDIVDGQFTIGQKIYEIQDLFDLLEALGIQLTIKDGRVLLNGVQLKERSQISKYECPLTQVCERREFFLKKLEYIQEKVRTGKIIEQDMKQDIEQDIMLENIRYHPHEPEPKRLQNTPEKTQYHQNDMIQENEKNEKQITPEERALAEEELIEKTIAQLLSRNRRNSFRTKTRKTVNEKTQICPNCKREIPLNWAYCSFCGKKL